MQHYADVAKAAPEKLRWQLGLIGAQANLAAVEATVKQWSGDYSAAATGFTAAADLFTTQFLPHVDEFPRPDFVVDTIEFTDWAGLAVSKAGLIEEGHATLNRALAMVQQYRAVMGDKNSAILERRVQGHLDEINTQLQGRN